MFSVMALAKETYFSKVFLALIFICSVGCSKIEEDCLKYEYEVYRRDTMSGRCCMNRPDTFFLSGFN